MSLLNLIGISTAHAATTGTHQSPAGMFSPLIIMALFVVVFYFILIRPQSRKRKEHAKLVNDISVGDDIVTIGGIVGRVNQLKDDFVQVSVSKDTTITMQKSSIANVLPKGTFDA